MGDPAIARTQRRHAIDSRMEKKRKDAETKKRAAAAKRDKLKPGDVNEPGVSAGDITLTPNAPSGVQSGAPNRKRRRQNPATNDDSEDDEDTPPVLHPDDPAHFLKLSRALRILLAREITEDQIDEADVLLRTYTSEIVNVSNILFFEPCLT